jgi:hypothetical protein
MSNEQALAINPEIHMTIDKIKSFATDNDRQIVPAEMRPEHRHRARRMLLLYDQYPEYEFQDVCAENPDGFGTDIRPCVACDGDLKPEYHIHFIMRFLKGKGGVGPQEVWTGIRWTTAAFISDIIESDYREYCALKGFKLPL